MRKPKEIKIERHSRPESHCVAWTAEPKTCPFTGNVKAEDRAAARVAIEREIRADGVDPLGCEIAWHVTEGGWGWVARVKETA